MPPAPRTISTPSLPWNAVGKLENPPDLGMCDRWSELQSNRSSAKTSSKCRKAWTTFKAGYVEMDAIHILLHSHRMFKDVQLFFNYEKYVDSANPSVFFSEICETTPPSEPGIKDGINALVATAIWKNPLGLPTHPCRLGTPNRFCQSPWLQARRRPCIGGPDWLLDLLDAKKMPPLQKERHLFVCTVSKFDMCCIYCIRI